MHTYTLFKNSKIYIQTPKTTVSRYMAHDEHPQAGSFWAVYDSHTTHDMLPQHITKLITDCFKL